MMMLDRMETGRLKVLSDLRDWFEECSLYHRRDGRVVKEREDLLCATCYALMMLRFSEVADRVSYGRTVRLGKPNVRSWMGT